MPCPPFKKTGAVAALPTATLTAHSVSALEWGETNPFPPPAVIYNAGTAQVRLENTGIACKFETDSIGNENRTDFGGEWLLSGTAGQFEVFATVLSGTLDFGTAGSWLNLGTTRDWGVTWAAVGSKTATVQLQIRRVSDAVVQATATQTLTVSRF